MTSWLIRRPRLGSSPVHDRETGSHLGEIRQEHGEWVAYSPFAQRVGTFRTQQAAAKALYDAETRRQR